MNKVKIVFVLILVAMTNVFAAEVKSQVKENSASQNSTSNSTSNSKVQFVKNLQTLLEKGDMQKAIESFDSLNAESKKDVNLLLIKASLLISASRPQEATELLNQLEAQDPSNLDVLETKIIAAKASGPKFVNAKKNAISKVIALDPYNSTANIELAQEAVLGKKYKTALGYYKKALAKSPNSQEALFGVGQTSYYLNNIDDSKAAFKKILEKNPSSAISYQYLGKLEAENENYKKALEYINQAIQIEDDNYDFYMDLGQYSRLSGKFADAEKAWSKAIELNPDYFLAYAYRAGFYDEQNKFELALNDYRKVIETNPNYYFAYEALGILAWHENQFDEARAAFEKAYEYYKSNVSYPLMIAACYIKTGNLQKAKLFLQGVMKAQTDKTTIEFQMLRLYHDQGPGNAENDLAVKIPKIDKTTPRGKMLYYFALFYDLKGVQTLSTKYYTEVKNMQSPMFFEYRLAEWSLEK